MLWLILLLVQQAESTALDYPFIQVPNDIHAQVLELVRAGGPPQCIYGRLQNHAYWGRYLTVDSIAEVPSTYDCEGFGWISFKNGLSFDPRNATPEEVYHSPEYIWADKMLELHHDWSTVWLVFGVINIEGQDWPGIYVITRLTPLGQERLNAFQRG